MDTRRGTSIAAAATEVEADDEEAAEPAEDGDEVGALGAALMEALKASGEGMNDASR